jgi:LL-diaminopimelate aminotransferase
MAFVNENYEKLQDSYLFANIAQKVAAFQKEHPEKKIIRMGIGDVTLPLAPVVVDAMTKAVAEMGRKETFRGYGPEQGYDFLHQAVVRYYASFGVSVDTQEIFISDGAKSDCGNITDIFSDDNVILLPDPVYPVYYDTNVMRGRKVLFMKGSPENDFLPMPDDSVKADVIYLCSPNNPTGAAYSREQLEQWVAYAKKNDAVILYDAAYESFIDEGGSDAAEHLHGRRGQGLRHRDVFLLEDGRIYRNPLRLHGRTAGAEAQIRRRHGNEPQQDVAPPSDHQIQWRRLHRAARR